MKNHQKQMFTEEDEEVVKSTKINNYRTPTIFSRTNNLTVDEFQ